MVIFYTPNYQTGGHIAYFKGIPMMSLAKAIGTGNYDFYACQYQIGDISFPVYSTSNRHGKRIVIPGPSYILFQK